MYKYGGLYSDMDYLPFKPFDLLNENNKSPLTASADTKTKGAQPKPKEATSNEKK